MEIENRWIEIRFYFLCLDILNKTKRIPDLMDFIDSFAIFGNYNTKNIQELAQKILSDPYMAPGRQEFLILARKHKVSITKYEKILQMSRKTIYPLVNEETKNPRRFFNRFNIADVEEMKLFLEAYENFKECGLGVK